MDKLEKNEFLAFLFGKGALVAACLVDLGCLGLDFFFLREASHRLFLVFKHEVSAGGSVVAAA